jgi:hypothetical protein
MHSMLLFANLMFRTSLRLKDPVQMLGAYALAFGVLLLIRAFKLRIAAAQSPR